MDPHLKFFTTSWTPAQDLRKNLSYAVPMLLKQMKLLRFIVKLTGGLNPISDVTVLFVRLRRRLFGLDSVEDVSKDSGISVGGLVQRLLRQDETSGRKFSNFLGRRFIAECCRDKERKYDEMTKQKFCFEVIHCLYSSITESNIEYQLTER